MNIIKKYESKKNKGLIWGVLMDNNLFSGLENNQYNKIFSLFEQKINEIKQTIQPNDSIISLNKKTMNGMVRLIKQEKETARKPVINPNIYNKQLNNKNNMLYKAEEIQKKRQEDMKKHYNQKQEEFNNVFKNKNPSEIDFSDKNDIDNSDIDKKLSEIMKKRVMDLDFKKTDIENANKWFKNSEKIDIPQVGTVNFLNIGENLDKSSELQPILIKKNNDNKLSNKRVTFNNKIETQSHDNNIQHNIQHNIKFNNFLNNLKIDVENKNVENKNVENKNVENKNVENKNVENKNVENKNVENSQLKDETIKLLREQIDSLRMVIESLKLSIDNKSENIVMIDKSTNTQIPKKIDNKLLLSMLKQ
jgi:hypothetical protein